MQKKIRVLVVDDSALFRQVMTQILSESSDIEVVGTAMDAHIAGKKIEMLKPDVLTLDIEMPGMDGLTFLKQLMASKPMPVVMISSLTPAGSPAAFKALELGAVEVIGKPQRGLRESIEDMSIRVVDSVKAASRARIMTRRSTGISAPRRTLGVSSAMPRTLGGGSIQMNTLGSPAIQRRSSESPETSASYAALRAGSDKVIAIGASTGGTEALRILLMKLPEQTPGIVIVQHMPPVFTAHFAERLNKCCTLNIREAVDGEQLRSGTALISPGDKHMELVKSGAGYCVKLNEGALVNRHRPSVDVLFQSVADTARNHALGVILTGMGDDGANGMLAMKKAGAVNIAQNEKTCVVFGMPRVAIKRGGVDHVAGIEDIPSKLVSLLTR